MSASVETTCSTFPQFTNLALELRNQIWKNALPKKIEPALYFYKKGCWQPRWLTEFDEYKEYDAENNEHNLRLEFYHDLLDHVQVHTPLVFVNNEARDIAVDWARGQGLTIDDNKGYPIFSSPFVPERDILYVRPGEMNEFSWEPLNRPFEPDMIQRNFSIRSFVQKLAMSEESWSWAVERDLVRDLNEQFSLQALLIVIDTPPGLRGANNDFKAQSRWELEETQGGEYVWDHGCFKFQGSKYDGKEELYRLLETGIKGLAEELVSYDRPSDSGFRVQPALVIQK